MPSRDQDDQRWMARAIALARQGLGRTWPNPAVGAVFVRNGRVIGEGFHRRAGGPHAEIVALEAARGRIRDADLFVTLEPCAHHGRTGPCVEALVGAGLRRVVVATADPNPRVRGRGLARLRQDGIEVVVGPGADASREILAGYHVRMRTGRPRVTLKVAATLDGRVATGAGESKWITGRTARTRGHVLRAESDAILVGAGTVRADDPRLTVRAPGRGRRVRIVVAGRQLAFPLTSRVFDDSAPTWVLLPRGGSATRRRALERRGVVVIEVAARAGRMDFGDVLDVLGGRGLTSVLVEGGPFVATRLLEASLVDRLAWFSAPMSMGGDGRAAIGPLGVRTLAEAPRFRPTAVERLGADTLILAVPDGRRRIASPRRPR